MKGARNGLCLGTCPDTGLALARRKADEARKLVSEGTDPSDVRKAAKADNEHERDADRLADAGLPPAGSFEVVAREWLATVHEAKVSAKHAERTRIRVEQDVVPWLGRARWPRPSPPNCRPDCVVWRRRAPSKPRSA